MKKWIRFGAAAALALMLCAVFGRILTIYFRPMESAVYDLSMGWTTEAIPDDWVYDQKGWTVFTQEGDAVTELIPDGFGGFSGLEEPGKTFYFSRVIEEDLDSPTLHLDTADQTFSVFLDGTLIYTDCPELDNRIGSLCLPVLDWYREEGLLVRLPLDCAGETLTIAQSTAPVYDRGYEKVRPCAVTLYCGYAYESALISESFRTATPASLAYAAGVVLLALFLWQAFRGRLEVGILCGALAIFSYLSSCIARTSFHILYFDWMLVDVDTLCRSLPPILLLTMLLCKLSGWRKAVLGMMTAVLAGLLAVQIALLTQDHAGMIPLTLWFSFLGALGLGLAMAFGFWEWNRRRWFFRIFCPLALAGTVLYVLPTVLAIDPAVRSVAIFLWPLTGVSMSAAFLSTVAEWVQGEAARRTEERLLLQRGELVQNSYEAMRRQHEQVMVLHHDMMKHFQLLRQTTSDEKTAAYLDELIGENEKIRPVVQSGNEMLDVILNGKLSAVGDGIEVELARTKASDKLPLTDVELCSLVMNLMDNALEASAAPGVKRRYIKLDMHIRKSYFVFCLENGATLDWINKETAPEHGLGLKAVRQIVERYGGLSDTEYGDDYYRVTVLLPLHQRRR